MAEGLSVRGVSVRRGDRQVLRDVSLQAGFGEISAVLGPNGAGKSTLLRAIAGLIDHGGEVTLEGQALRTIHGRERARRLSFVPQASMLNAAVPVRDVVAQGRFAHRVGLGGLTADDRRAVEAAMEQTDVAFLADRGFTRLSFGEQRRVLLARALATGARTILLDEPTASLDVRHALTLYQLLRELAHEGCCVVVVLHQLDDVRQYTDRATLLDNGKVAASAPSAELVLSERAQAVYGVEFVQGGGLGFRLPGGPKETQAP